MNKNLNLLLELEGLVLLRQGLESAGLYVHEDGFADLNVRIDRLRRRLPGELLSHYDRLARRYTNTITTVFKNVCQACHGEISRRRAALIEHGRHVPQCEHCGRFLLADENAPAYVP